MTTATKSHIRRKNVAEGKGQTTAGTLTVDEWIAQQLRNAPEPSDALMRRVSHLLFGGDRDGVDA